MSIQKNLLASIQMGNKFLKKEQQRDGSFLSLSSSTNNFIKPIKFHSTFTTALILQILKKIKSDDALTNRAAQFLLSQRSSFWSWNYWARDSKEARDLPYPDDLDDTFCALAALKIHSPDLITGKVLAYATSMLTMLETKEGGPYKTWLVSEKTKKEWKDVDLGVNANIAYFLYLNEITLPSLAKLFSKAIKNKNFTTPYYPEPYPVIYFLSRFIKERKSKDLIEIIKNRKTKNSLQLALKITSLINLGYDKKLLDKDVKKLISMQGGDGSWPACVFYTGVNPNKDKTFYAGSYCLTTAFCLEALSSYSQKKDIQSLDRQSIKIHKQILEKVEERFEELGKDLQLVGKKYLKQILNDDKGRQITLLPLFFSKTIRSKGKKVSSEMLLDLGLASVYGWIAYTIYDNFLDEEAEISSLPLANVCLRELTEIFGSVLPSNNGFREVFREIMDKIEEANTWEVNNCRFDIKNGLNKVKIPDYKNYDFLADRSSGHALGCVAILMSKGYKKNSVEVKNLLLFFKHYLIAKQINDDAHDWEKDLKKGQINSVGAMLLLKRRKGLENFFWNEIIDQACDLILLHSKKARRFLSRISAIEDRSMFENLIKRQEGSAKLVKREKKNTVSFFKNYFGST